MADDSSLVDRLQGIAERLPQAFFSVQPDRTKILAHVRETAEVPEGAEVAETKPTVYPSAPKAT